MLIAARKPALKPNASEQADSRSSLGADWPASLLTAFCVVHSPWTGRLIEATHQLIQDLAQEIPREALEFKTYVVLGRTVS
ncbi:hypothetical protein T440DRAFT_275428 [Plenodomus tracheiphilus IPT5]|uniref:Uncharacterized protein n=1 Tax=Plenodomus tracheiphilus IPT5 TaxID=1408161 RepID=A0A6A7BJ48_9PLEO|nr:hypothetical protein T440DRAFT_275428 [Plenodomus tracheiphilus IPT5]